MWEHMSDPLFPIVDYGITLTEIPDYIALFLEFGNCTARCPGCHSENLWLPVDNPMSMQEVVTIATKYRELGCNAIVLMGGTTNSIEKSDLRELLSHLKGIFGNCVGLFSGQDAISDHAGFMRHLRWLKVGHYDETKGGLNRPLTNQRFYEIINNRAIDKTYLFRRDASV